MTYSIQDLGTISGFTTAPADVNNGGVVVGTLRGTGTSQAFSWGSTSGIRQLSALSGAIETEARAINNAGVIAGKSAETVVQWNAAGTISALAPPPMPQTFAHDVNDAGKVAGGFIQVGPQEHPRIFQPGAPPIDPPNSLGGIWDEALGLNNHAPPVAVGTAMVGSGGPTHAFSWTVGGPLVDLTPGLGTNSAARAVNMAEDIVGESSINAVVWRKGGGTPEVIPALSGFDAGSARDINLPGEIIGDSFFSFQPFQSRPFLYRAFRRDTGGPTSVSPPEVVDLNSLIAAGSGWVLEHATAINDNGWIVGTGQLNGSPRGFVLIPPSAPITCPCGAAIALGVLVGAIWLATRRRRVRLI